MAGGSSANDGDPWKDILMLTLGQPPFPTRRCSLCRRSLDVCRSDNVTNADGGGTRGYASLRMLQVLMDRVQEIEQRESEHFPAHYSSFGRSEGDSKLVAKSTTPEPVSYPAPNPGPHRDSSPAQTTYRRSTLAARREKAREGLLDERPKYLPCHYFDYIGGTSTGGLAALMLGRLRMSADECTKIYPDIAKGIFGTKKSLAVAGIIRDRYFATNLEKVIDEIVLERLPERPPKKYLQLASPEDLCKTVLVARRDHQRDGPYLFRSYSTNENSTHPHNPGPANTCPIWQAGRATSAAPHYFKPITIGNHTYYDGGVGYNDPTAQIYDDVCMRDVLGKDDPARISMVLTLGTGTQSGAKTEAILPPMANVEAHGRPQRVAKKFKDLCKDRNPVKRMIRTYNRVVRDTATSTEPVVRAMKVSAEEKKFKYLKWEGGEEVGSLGLDNCKPKAFAKMERGVSKYMEARDSEIEEVATLLVKTRRRRFEHEGKWQRFAYCTIFDCPLKECELSQPLGTTAALKDHIEREHGGRFTDPDSEVGQARLVKPDLRGPFGHRLPFAPTQDTI